MTTPTTPILTTKLAHPPPRPHLVVRSRLSARLTAGLPRKLTLLSAPAGFGKTTLIGQWLAECDRPVAWLSLDAGDRDLARFLLYLIAALRSIAPTTTLAAGVLAALHSPQPPSTEALLTALLNDVASFAATDHFILVLDDYHLLDAPTVDQALSFLLEHLPPQLHLVLATREDPPLPLARLRAGGQLSELRAADLRFTAAEAAAFLTEVMGLRLSAGDIRALEARTEGWIAGLQLAALSLHGLPDPHDATRFIAAFSGSNRFVMDYLVEEVLHQQPEPVQMFLLRTSILDRLCGSLCEAVLGDAATAVGSGQATLEYLDRANLFVVPLDHERRWYRYHHLFAELLRQRLAASSTGEAGHQISELHRRASIWYEHNGLVLEAFQHAAATHDVEHAVRLLDGKRIPLHVRGAVTAILDWLASLPARELDTRPWLMARYAGLLLVNGQATGVEEKLQAAEIALEGAELDEQTRDLIGQIATARATLAFGQYQAESMLVQSRRALEHLHPHNLPFRMTAYWTEGFAHLFQGDRVAARRAYSAAIALSQASGNSIFTLMATTGLGTVEEADNQLHLADETYRRVLQLAGDMPLPIIYEAHLGLARILYEWNDLEDAERHGRESLHLARQYERGIDRFIACEVFLARLRLAHGDVAGAATILAQVAQSARQQHFVHRLPEIAAAQVVTLLRQGHLAAAAQLARQHDLPLIQARIHLAQGDPAAALAVLASWRREVEEKDWADERLKVLVLQAVALHARSGQEQAVPVLLEALALAEPEGFIRMFIDEGPPMVGLLATAAARGLLPDYVGKLLAACDAEQQRTQKSHLFPITPAATAASTQPLIEPLSHREREVLQLIAQGLSNQEIGERLFLALSTVKGHNRTIFDKLQVQRRTEAVARARELDLL